MKALPVIVLAGVIACLVLPPAAGAAVGLTPSLDSPLSVGGSPTFIAHGQFDGGSGEDIAVLDPAAQTVTIWRGLFHGRLALDSVLNTGTAPKMIAVGDFNGDGDPDLAVPNSGDGTVSTYLGSPVGTHFSTGPVITVGTSPQYVAIDNFDAGGDPDLAVVNRDSDNVSIVTGAAGATFNVPVNIALAAGTHPVAVDNTDANGDGDPDLVIGNDGTDNVTVLTGAANAGFTFSSTFATGALKPDFVKAADMNGDGDPDLAIAHKATNSIKTFIGGAGASFTPGSSINQPTLSLGFDVADIDGDGDPDLLNLVNSTDSDLLVVHKGTGATAATFAPSTSIRVPDGPTGVAGYTAAGGTAFPESQVVVAGAAPAGLLTVLNLNRTHLILSSATADNAEVGKVAVNPQPVVFTNDGFDTITPTRIVTSGQSDDYFVSSDSCTGNPLAKGASCTVSFRFAPRATGTRSITVSVADGAVRLEALDAVTFSRTGLAATAGPAGPAGTNGTNGTNGATGATGATGPPGTNGADGTTGATGATGPAGPAGPQGPSGPAGPQGQPGRDAIVTCKPKKAAHGKVKVTCSVKLVKHAGAARVSARLTRGRTVYASGTSAATGAGHVRLHARRPITAGSYRLTLVVTGADHHRTTSHQRIQVG